MKVKNVFLFMAIGLAGIYSTAYAMDKKPKRLIHNETCPLCLEELKNKEVVVFSRCSHATCKDCDPQERLIQCPWCRVSTISRKRLREGVDEIVHNFGGTDDSVDVLRRLVSAQDSTSDNPFKRPRVSGKASVDTTKEGASSAEALFLSDDEQDSTSDEEAGSFLKRPRVSGEAFVEAVKKGDWDAGSILFTTPNAVKKEDVQVAGLTAIRSGETDTLNTLVSILIDRYGYDEDVLQSWIRYARGCAKKDAQYRTVVQWLEGVLNEPNQ